MTAPVAADVTTDEGQPRWLPVSLALARRSLVASWRVPAAVIPLAIMPVFFVVVFSGSFGGLRELPSFPTDNVYSWVLPFGIVQGAAFAGMGTGFGLVRDIQSGFFDRLLLLPGGRAGILLGPLWSALVRAVLTTVVVFAFGLLIGADFPGGLLGVLVVAASVLGVTAMALAWTIGLVLRMPSMRAAPLIQVGIFFPTFLSTGQVPLADQTGWAHAVARVNPITNILELTRQGMLGHIAWESTWPGLLALGSGVALLWTFAATGLRRLDS